MAHAADFAEPDQMVGVSSSLLLAWAAGAAVGPSIAAPFIDLIGPGGLFIYSFLVAAGLARVRAVAHDPACHPCRRPRKEGFVNLPATTPRPGRHRPPHAGAAGRLTGR